MRMTTSLITAGGYKMLVRSIALAVVLFIPANFTGQGAVEKIEHVTVIYRNAAKIVWDSPQIRPRSPGIEVWDIPKEITARIIPEAKPKTPKCRKGEKQWRTLPGGHRKYRLRRTC